MKVTIKTTAAETKPQDNRGLVGLSQAAATMQWQAAGRRTGPSALSHAGE